MLPDKHWWKLLYRNYNYIAAETLFWQTEPKQPLA